MIAISLLNVAGAITIDTLKFYALAGLWLGFACYGKLEDATFRKLVLVLLLCAGLALIAARRRPLIPLSSPGVVSTLPSPAFAGPVCRSALSLTRATLLEMRPLGMERRWTATIFADAPRGASKARYSGLGFLYEKENRLSLEFSRATHLGRRPWSRFHAGADEAIEHA
jgi:hypothetical protein